MTSSEAVAVLLVPAGLLCVVSFAVGLSCMALISLFAWARAKAILKTKDPLLALVDSRLPTVSNGRMFWILLLAVVLLSPWLAISGEDNKEPLFNSLAQGVLSRLDPHEAKHIEQQPFFRTGLIVAASMVFVAMAVFSLGPFALVFFLFELVLVSWRRRFIVEALRRHGTRCLKTAEAVSIERPSWFQRSFSFFTGFPWKTITVLETGEIYELVGVSFRNSQEKEAGYIIDAAFFPKHPMAAFFRKSKPQTRYTFLPKGVGAALNRPT